MEITIGKTSCSVNEQPTKWIVTRSFDKLKVSVELSKELCPTESALNEYIATNVPFLNKD